MTADASFLYPTANWADVNAIHDVFTRLRAEDPVHFCTTEGYPDLWHVTKHADIFDVERRTGDFLNEPRLVLATSEQEAKIRAQNNGSLNRIRSLVTYDAPEHMKLRLLTQSWFMPKNLDKLQSRISGSVEGGMRVLKQNDGTCDFARDVALEYPLRVIMAVLGVPENDYGMMLRLTQEQFGPEDPDIGRDVEEGVDADAALAETINDLFAYFTALTKEKMQNPGDDVASIIANAEIDGAPLDDMGKLGYYIIVATAGHDTTSYSLSEAVHQLARDPALFDRLKQAPNETAPLITEEAIRYASSVRHFIRTANKDTELGGKTISEGQSLILWYPSGSRDEDVFENPHSFDIDRDRSTRHAAFGHGAHMCLGMHLARLEIDTFLRALAAKVDAIDLMAEPKYVQANFVGGIKSLPVRMTLAQQR
ncbi:MAG: cytochrome P450 [Pseudomonadota bacterium]